MKPVLELDMKNPAEEKALRTVIQKAAIGKVVASVKQTIQKGDDFDIKMIDTAVTEAGALISLNGEYLYFTIRDLKRHNVKRVQALWKTVLKRVINRFEEGEANDYFMTVDCVTIDEGKSKVFTFGCLDTPVFCSSDGDDDLTMAVKLADCYISIDRYNAKEIAYEAIKAEEKGEKVTPLMTMEYKEDTPEVEQRKQSEEFTNLMDKIGKNIDEE